MDSNIVLWLVFFLNFYVLPTCVGCLAGWLPYIYLFIYFGSQADKVPLATDSA